MNDVLIDQILKDCLSPDFKVLLDSSLINGVLISEMTHPFNKGKTNCYGGLFGSLISIGNMCLNKAFLCPSIIVFDTEGYILCNDKFQITLFNKHAKRHSPCNLYIYFCYDPYENLAYYHIDHSQNNRVCFGHIDITKLPGYLEQLPPKTLSNLCFELLLKHDFLNEPHLRYAYDVWIHRINLHTAIWNIYRR
ncbi:hypothetical protein HN014_10810 [Aquimarina sp. TRL1]|uniref:hypothetical protein n=1 Tax=Aquimarina sp. (strain TRL1) TaxID=2736252 RepID=UPI00158B209B|nr:hypothetical protein [Aquimarina sp. TRL1]QKX05383.1 hypothetical protein HN014_10810 [Aquimarina sp. TRL1]